MPKKSPDLTVSVPMYCYLIENLHKGDISENSSFQKKFNHFFRFNRFPSAHKSAYFKMLEKNKNNPNISFKEILLYLQKLTGNLYPSFSSKMLALIDPNKYPIWDTVVLAKLGLKHPYYRMKNREEAMVNVYNEICKKYKTSDLNEFLLEYENRAELDQNISRIKKIDFILWSKR